MQEDRRVRGQLFPMAWATLLSGKSFGLFRTFLQSNSRLLSDACFGGQAEPLHLAIGKISMCTTHCMLNPLSKMPSFLRTLLVLVRSYDVSPVAFKSFGRQLGSLERFGGENF